MSIRRVEDRIVEAIRRWGLTLVAEVDKLHFTHVGSLEAHNMVDASSEGLSASLEDYLEVIFHLEQSNRVARAKDIADQMHVQRASVTGALKALAGRGLINYSPYSYITLTSAGRSVAQDVIHRHETLKEFFSAALQLGPIEAEANACRIEHAIDPIAVDRLVRFLEFIKMCPRTSLDWFTAFARYCQQGSQTSNCEDCVKVCLEKITPTETTKKP